MGDFASTPKTKYGNEYRYRLNWYLACVGTLKSQWCNMWNEHATITSAALCRFFLIDFFAR